MLDANLKIPYISYIATLQVVLSATATAVAAATALRRNPNHNAAETDTVEPSA